MNVPITAEAARLLSKQSKLAEAAAPSAAPKPARASKSVAAPDKRVLSVPSAVEAPVLSTTKSLGPVVAYAVRQIGREWPGTVWSHEPSTLSVRPGWELVKMTIEPVN